MAGLRPTGIEYPVGSGTYIDIERDTSDYQALFLADQTYAVTATPTTEPRRNSTGLLTSITVDGRTIPMTILRKSSSAVTGPEFHANVKRWFDPGKGRGGTRYLRILGDDGVTLYRLPVHVIYLAPRPGAIDVYDVQMQAVTPYFEALVETSDVITISGTVTNSGNAHAQATLEISGGTSINGNQYTVTDNTGRGLVNYPVVIADVAPTVSQADSYVLVGGKSAAFAQGATSASYWIFIDLPASESVTVDILRNTSVTNPLAGMLDMGNLDAASTANDRHEWGSLNVDGVPQRTGLWQASTLKMNTWIEADSLMYQASDISLGHSITLSTTNPSLDNNANALIVTLGAAATSLVNLSRATTDVAGTFIDVRAYVRSRTVAGGPWKTLWSTMSNVTVTTSIALPAGTVEIAMGLESTSDLGAPESAKVVFSWATTPGYVTLHNGPTLSAATATTWRLLDGTVINDNTGQIITFNNLIRRDGTLTIAATSDYTRRRIENSASGPILGAVTFTDTTDLFSLDPDANTISETIDGSVTVKHRATVL